VGDKNKGMAKKKLGLMARPAICVCIDDDQFSNKQAAQAAGIANSRN
jgi:hypothetical protein